MHVSVKQSPGRRGLQLNLESDLNNIKRRRDGSRNAAGDCTGSCLQHSLFKVPWLLHCRSNHFPLSPTVTPRQSLPNLKPGKMQRRSSRRRRQRRRRRTKDFKNFLSLPPY
uniref:Mitochondrial thiamine pyrophosphate carrier-like isoform X2 n=1 Tax=Rhizophora mucronata TaxID=61149 RepID=A0A2P2K0F7_RHIMU